MPILQRLFLLLVAILLAACSVSGLSVTQLPVRASETPVTQVVVRATPTITPTPFRPLPPTPTYLPPTPTYLPPTPTLQPTAAQIVSQPEKPRRERKATKFPAPSEYPTIPIPPPAGRLKLPQGQVNILVLGSDQPPNANIFRTDTILLVSLNPKKKSVNLISFPRDLFVYIPGWTMQRINTAYAHGGYETIALTMEYNFGVRPDHYVIINYKSFVRFINSLGGIDVKVDKPLSDNRNQRGWVTIKPGKVHMDGKDALWYVRSRYTTNDFDRNRRQQAVIRAVLERLLSIDAISQAPELYEAYARSITTDMRFKDFLALLPFAAQIRKMSQVNHYFIDSSLVTEWITPGGAMVLLPDQQGVLNVMRQAVNSR
jgi:LCP family protein required for cell wall assembly